MVKFKVESIYNFLQKLQKLFKQLYNFWVIFAIDIIWSNEAIYDYSRTLLKVPKTYYVT